MPFLYEFKLNEVKLKGVEIGFSHSRKWEEALDEAKMSLPFYTSESPLSQYGLVEITIQEVDNYTDLNVVDTETLEMLIISDKPSPSSQYGIWRHDIHMIEYTGKLDAYIMASLARTRDLENKTLAKFEVTDDGASLNFGADIQPDGSKYNFQYSFQVWLPPIHIQTNYYTDTVYTLEQVEQAYQLTSFTDNYVGEFERRPTIFRIVNADTAAVGSWITLSDSDRTIEFTSTGNYWIEYGIDSVVFPAGRPAGEYPIFRFFVKVIDQYSQTVYDAINSVRQNVSKGGGIESEFYFDDTRIFDIDSNYETFLKSVQLPQIYLEKATARQMLIFVMSYINAHPRLEYNANGVDNLTLEKFNLSTGEFTEEDVYTKSGHQNTNQIGTRSYSPLNQVLPNNMDEPTTYSPSQDGLQQVRAADLQITDASFSIKLQKEIYTPKSLEVYVPSIDFTNDNVVGFDVDSYEDLEVELIPRLIDLQEWKLKLVTDNFPSITTKQFYDSDVGLRQDMVENLYWTLGSKSINLSDVYGTLVNRTLFQNVIKLGIYEFLMLNMPKPYIYTYDPGGPQEAEVMVYDQIVGSINMTFLTNTKAYKDLRFRFSYLTIEELVIKSDKEDLSQIDFYSELRQNQDESIVNVVRSSRKNYGDLQRTGNKTFSFSKLHHKLNEAYEVGKKDVNEFTIVNVERQFFGRYFLAEYFVTKHHNRESRQTLVDQTYRWRDNYAKNVLNRHEHYNDYIVIHPPTGTINLNQKTKIYSKLTLYPNMFALLLGEDVSDLETRATVALIRTDGMLELEEETTNYLYGILTPVSAYPVKNGLAFTLGFDSNQVAGDGLVKRGSNWYNQAVRYTNLQARFSKFGFHIMPKYEFEGNDFEEYPKISRNSYYSLIAKQQRYFSTGDFTPNEVGDDTLIADKDPLTNWNITYQLNFLSFYMNQYILGQQFFSWNFLVNNPDKEEVITYLYLYKDDTVYELFEDLFVKEGYDSATQLDNTKIRLDVAANRIEFIGSIDLTGVTSWAIGNDLDDLYIACNEGLNGFKIVPEHYRTGVREIGNKDIYYPDIVPPEIDVLIHINISPFGTGTAYSFTTDINLDVSGTGHLIVVFSGGGEESISIDVNATGTFRPSYGGGGIESIELGEFATGTIRPTYVGGGSEEFEIIGFATGALIPHYQGGGSESVTLDVDASGTLLVKAWANSSPGYYASATTKYDIMIDESTSDLPDPIGYNVDDALKATVYDLELSDLAEYLAAGTTIDISTAQTITAGSDTQDVEAVLEAENPSAYATFAAGTMTDTVIKITDGSLNITYWKPDYSTVLYKRLVNTA